VEKNVKETSIIITRAKKTTTKHNRLHLNFRVGSAKNLVKSRLAEMSSLLKSERIKRINKTSKEILMNFALFYIKRR
jgi:hypothetical protein